MGGDDEGGLLRRSPEAHAGAEGEGEGGLCRGRVGEEGEAERGAAGEGGAKLKGEVAGISSGGGGGDEREAKNGDGDLGPEQGRCPAILPELGGGLHRPSGGSSPATGSP